MNSVREDLSILYDFNFERPPVGVKFLLTKPDGIERIGEQLTMCEMLPKAQAGNSFYAMEEDIACVGPLYLGMSEKRVYSSGLLGSRLKLFKEARATKKLYDVIPRLPKGSVKYVAFSPLDKLSFDPDVLVITANPTQAEILLRASGFSTGRTWSGRVSSAVVCSFVFIYPYLNSEINYVVVPLGGFSQGMLGEGEIVISIPFDLLPELIKNLHDIEWVTPLQKASRAKIMEIANKMYKEIAAEIGEE